MRSQAKWFILLILVNSGFEEIYDTKKYCNKVYKTTRLDTTRLISIDDLFYNFNNSEVLVNISIIVKTPTPGATAYICLNVILQGTHNRMDFMQHKKGCYCTLFAGSYVVFKYHNQEIPEICSNRTLPKNRGSWFATNMVLFTNGTLLISFEDYKIPFMVCNILKFKRPNYLSLLSFHVRVPMEYYYDCLYFMNTLRKPVAIEAEEEEARNPQVEQKKKTIKPLKIFTSTKKVEQNVGESNSIQSTNEVKPIFKNEKDKVNLKEESSIHHYDYLPLPQNQTSEPLQQNEILYKSNLASNDGTLTFVGEPVLTTILDLEKDTVLSSGIPPKLDSNIDESGSGFLTLDLKSGSFTKQLANSISETRLNGPGSGSEVLMDLESDTFESSITSGSGYEYEIFDESSSGKEISSSETRYNRPGSGSEVLKDLESDTFESIRLSSSRKEISSNSNINFLLSQDFGSGYESYGSSKELIDLTSKQSSGSGYEYDISTESLLGTQIMLESESSDGSGSGYDFSTTVGNKLYI